MPPIDTAQAKANERRRPTLSRNQPANSPPQNIPSPRRTRIRYVAAANRRRNESKLSSRGREFLLTRHPAPIEPEKPLCRNDPLIVIEDAKVLAELRDS